MCDLVVGAITGTEDEKEFHEQSWFIVVVVLIGMVVVTCLVLMIVCVARSVRRNKNHEGKYNGKCGHGIVYGNLCILEMGQLYFTISSRVYHDTL